MFVKQDYDYQELEKLITAENLELYYLIKNNNQQDNFVFLVQDQVAEVVTPEELNEYMKEQEQEIINHLNLK